MEPIKATQASSRSLMGGWEDKPLHRDLRRAIPGKSTFSKGHWRYSVDSAARRHSTAVNVCMLVCIFMVWE
jgi:hypothetical protein